MQTLILKPHQSLSPHILIELFDRIEQVLDDRVIDFVLKGNETNRPAHVYKGSSVDDCTVMTVQNSHCLQEKSLSFSYKAFKQTELKQLEGVVENVFSLFVAGLIS